MKERKYEKGYDIFVGKNLVGRIWGDEIKVERISPDAGEIKVIKDGQEVAVFEYPGVRIENSIWD